MAEVGKRRPSGIFQSFSRQTKMLEIWRSCCARQFSRRMCGIEPRASGGAFCAQRNTGFAPRNVFAELTRKVCCAGVLNPMKERRRRGKTKRFGRQNALCEVVLLSIRARRSQPFSGILCLRVPVAVRATGARSPK